MTFWLRNSSIMISYDEKEPKGIKYDAEMFTCGLHHDFRLPVTRRTTMGVNHRRLENSLLEGAFHYGIFNMGFLGVHIEKYDIFENKITVGGTLLDQIWISLAHSIGLAELVT